MANIYDPDYKDMANLTRCFLCGTQLTKFNNSKEHVFPKWLIEKCGLWDHSINLLNRTTMLYRHLAIPCCLSCNNGVLSRLEAKVKSAFDQGPEGVAALDMSSLFLWMAKIHYGIMFKELSLPVDRRNPSIGNIVSPEYLDSFKMQHILLQAIRGVVDWDPQHRNPASMFIFRCRSYVDPESNFDYRDGRVFPFLAIRIGETAVMACLEDWGALAQTKTMPMIEAAKQTVLHPMQFTQISAFGTYVTSLYRGQTKMIFTENRESLKLSTVLLQSTIEGSLYEDFVEEDYAQALAEAWLQPVGSIWDGKHIADVIQKSQGVLWPDDYLPDELDMITNNPGWEDQIMEYRRVRGHIKPRS